VHIEKGSEAKEKGVAGSTASERSKQEESILNSLKNQLQNEEAQIGEAMTAGTTTELAVDRKTKKTIDGMPT